MDRPVPEPTKVMFIGHSHARNLGSYLAVRHLTHFRLFETPVSVQFLGQGGRRIEWLMSDGIQNRVASFAPDQIILMIGDNDITVTESPEQVAYHLLAVATAMRNRFPSVKGVTITQLLPRYARTPVRAHPYPSRHIQWAPYNVKASQVNEILRTETESYPDISFLYTGFYFPDLKEVRYTQRRPSFSRDGVHLSDRGLHRQFRAFRGALMQM